MRCRSEVVAFGGSGVRTENREVRQGMVLSTVRPDENMAS